MLSFGTLYPLYSHISTDQFTEWALEYAKMKQILAKCYDQKIEFFDLEAVSDDYFSDLTMAHLLIDQLGCLINGETKAEATITLTWNESLGSTEYTSFTIDYWRDVQSGASLFQDTISNIAAEDIPDRIEESLNRFFGAASINAFASLDADETVGDGIITISIVSSLSYDGMTIVAVDTAAETLSMAIGEIGKSDTLVIGLLGCEEEIYARQLSSKIYSLLSRYCKYEGVVLNLSMSEKKNCDLVFAYSMEKNVSNTSGTGYFVPNDFSSTDFIIE